MDTCAQAAVRLTDRLEELHLRLKRRLRSPTFCASASLPSQASFPPAAKPLPQPHATPLALEEGILAGTLRKTNFWHLC